MQNQTQQRKTRCWEGRSSKQRVIVGVSPVCAGTDSYQKRGISRLTRFQRYNVNHRWLRKSSHVLDNETIVVEKQTNLVGFHITDSVWTQFQSYRGGLASPDQTPVGQAAAARLCFTVGLTMLSKLPDLAKIVSGGTSAKNGNGGAA